MRDEVKMKMQMTRWIDRNLHVTTHRLSEQDLQLWDEILETNPDQAHALAAFGYRRRQHELYGQDMFSIDELQEFVKEFVYKLQVAKEGEDCLRLPLFEFSVRNLRLERQGAANLC